MIFIEYLEYYGTNFNFEAALLRSYEQQTVTYRLTKTC